jgi:hypothetical protein
MKRSVLVLGLVLTLLLCACDHALPAPSTTAATTTVTEPLSPTVPSGPAVTQPTEAPCSHEWVLDENRPHTATCIDEGKEFYICTLCGEKKSEVKEAVGHNWANIRLVSGDCESGMTYHQRCRSCAAERDTTYKAGEHLPDLENPGRTYNPTCTEEGFTYFYCELCGERLKEVLPATGHSYGEDGLCAVCGEEKPAQPEAPEVPETTTTVPTT